MFALKLNKFKQKRRQKPAKDKRIKLSFSRAENARRIIWYFLQTVLKFKCMQEKYEILKINTFASFIGNRIVITMEVSPVGHSITDGDFRYKNILVILVLG